jgi:hypothetical protein
VLRTMKTFEPEGDYYALTLGANRRGRPFWSAQTHWIGFSERNPRWEVRAASLVNPRGIAEIWSVMGQDWVSVHDDASLTIYLRLGGNALVAKQVTEGAVGSTALRSHFGARLAHYGPNVAPYRVGPLPARRAGSLWGHDHSHQSSSNPKPLHQPSRHPGG